MPAARIHSSRAVLSFEWLGDSVLLVKLTGELADDSGPVLAATLDGSLNDRDEPVAMFWDLSGVRRWEPGGRRELMRTLLKHQHRIAEHYALATSPQLRMDVQTLGLFLGKMNLYHVRPLFNMAIEAAVGRVHRKCA